MANQRASRNDMQHPLDALSWPVLGVSVLSWPFLGQLLEHMPAPTVVYMAVSGGFMVFQMCDKLGWLERLKRNKDKRE